MTMVPNTMQKTSEHSPHPFEVWFERGSFEVWSLGIYHVSLWVSVPKTFCN